MTSFNTSSGDFGKSISNDAVIQFTVQGCTEHHVILASTMDDHDFKDIYEIVLNDPEKKSHIYAYDSNGRKGEVSQSSHQPYSCDKATTFRISWIDGGLAVSMDCFGNIGKFSY